MIYFLPIILLFLICSLCIYSTVTDIKYSIIQNKILIFACFGGGILNGIYMHFYLPGLINIYITNIVLSSIISIILYATHIWAAGDSKFLIALGVLMPANLCIYNGGYLFSGVVITVISFALSFVYILFDSIIIVMNKKEKFNLLSIKKEMKKFLLNYIINIIYITAILKMETLYLKVFYLKYGWFIFIINCCLMLLIGNFKILKNRYLVIGILILSVILSFFSGVWIINRTRFIYYLIIVALMIIKTFMNSFNYTVIKTEDVKKGMILSVGTTLLFFNSKIKGLPAISTEDLRSRLTADEAEVVKKWGKSKKGLEVVQVVKKVPFAIFMSIGTFLFMVLWGAMKWFFN